MQGMNRTKTNLIKEVNKNKIINLLVQTDELTKFDISKILNISIPTVTSNINELKEINMLDEVESEIYTGGRRPKIIKFKPNSRVSIGLRLSLDKVYIVMLNLRKEVIYTKSIDVKFKDFDEFMNWTNNIVKDILLQNNIDKQLLLGVGISIPGIINNKNNTIEYTNIGINNVNLDKYKELYDYEFYYDNEANLSLLCEKNYLTQEDNSNLIYLSINHGLGGAIMINNEIYRGRLGRSGEFGHLRLINDSNKNIEDYISTLNVVNMYNQANKDININTFKEFTVLVCNKDEIAQEIFNKSITTLNLCIYNLILIFDPSTILIGGEFSKLLKLHKDKITGNLENENSRIDLKEIGILYSNNDTPDLIGAALLPLDNFLKLDLDKL